MNITCIYIQWTDSYGRSAEATSNGEEIKRENLSIKLEWKKLSYGKILSLKARSDEKITFNELSLNMEIDLKGAKVMSNGYQTWTQSLETDDKSRVKRVSTVLYNLLKPYGDYSFLRYPRERGHIFSWTYTYIKRSGNPVTLMGSCSESLGYTIFDIDIRKDYVKIIKECQGMEFQGETEIMSVYIGEGNEANIWDEYFSYIYSYIKPSNRCTGWTSWYNYYTSVSEGIVLDNLKALSDNKIPLDVFQIDDGYQHAVGDWLDINDKFPSGMKAVADEIIKHGYKPGLWLAPFICEKKSHIFNEHPEWLLKDSRGRLVKAGWNPGWSGTFYSLDFYNESFREYLKKVMNTVLYDWGYEIVKLDFLYGVCVIPSGGRSRGQIMSEAMDFIRNLAGEKQVLGCGIPLGPAFGRVEYCRIGSDVAPYWEDKKLAFFNYRERVSTLNSLISTIGRWHLNGRAFGSDPDVFILRKNKNSLTLDEKYTLFVLNNIFGSLVFFSDDVRSYDEEEMNLLKSMYPRVNHIIKNVDSDDGLYKIELSAENKDYVIYSNLREKNVDIKLECRYFNSVTLDIQDGGALILSPHQTIILLKIDDTRSPYLIGSKGHILPGGQVMSFYYESGELKIELGKNLSPETEIYVGVDKSMKTLNANGKLHNAEDMGEYGRIVIKI